MRAAMTVLAVLTWLGCVPQRADEATPPPMATLTGIHLELFQGQDLAAFGRAAEVTYERMTGDLTASQVVVRISSHAEPGALRPAGTPELAGAATARAGGIACATGARDGGAVTRCGAGGGAGRSGGA